MKSNLKEHNKQKCTDMDTIKPVIYGHLFGRPPLIYSQTSCSIVSYIWLHPSVGRDYFLMRFEFEFTESEFGSYGQFSIWFPMTVNDRFYCLTDYPATKYAQLVYLHVPSGSEILYWTQAEYLHRCFNTVHCNNDGFFCYWIQVLFPFKTSK